MPRNLTRAAVVTVALIAGAMAANATAAPSLDSLRLPKKISAQQGHARFLAGIRISERAKLTVQVINAKDGSVVQSTTDTTARAKGRAYVRVEAVDDSGYQLPAGNYKLRFQATNDAGEASPPREGAFQLTLTTAHGRFDAYTIPLTTSLRRYSTSKVPGQYVAVVAPGGVLAKAGIRRGDVITAIGQTQVAKTGAFDTALRALQAETEIAISYTRNGQAAQATISPRPDWEAAPNYGPVFTVATRRDAKNLALGVARVHHLVSENRFVDADRAIKAWPKAWRTSGPGEHAQAELLAAQEKWRQALGAYNRARKKLSNDPAIELGRAVALLELDRTETAIGVLRRAGTLDDSDAEIAGYQAYAFLRAERGEDAVAAGTRAVQLDRQYADGYLPLGIAHLGLSQRAPGLQALRRGLILLDDDNRAARLITTYLNPTDP